MSVEINHADGEALSSLKAYAEKDPYDEEDMMALLNGNGTVPGDQPEFVRTIFNDMCRVVFTHEWQPIGICRHVSITFKQGYFDDIESAIANIMIHLGFHKNSEVHFHIEDDKIFSAIQLI